jgi:hypothetical protein
VSAHASTAIEFGGVVRTCRGVWRVRRSRCRCRPSSPADR